MSGLLVKSTVMMRDNLAELNSRGLAGRWPVLLGGAALTRSYVEQDLAELFDGEVRYARDAFEGLRLMDAADGGQARRARRGAARAARAPGPPPAWAGDDDQAERGSASAGTGQPGGATARALVRSDVRADVPVPQPPFFGTRVVKGIPLADYASYLDERALFLGPVGPQADPGRRPGHRTRNWPRRRAGRGCGCGWSGRRPRACCRRPWCTATSRASARATT